MASPQSISSATLLDHGLAAIFGEDDVGSRLADADMEHVPAILLSFVEELPLAKRSLTLETFSIPSPRTGPKLP
jgi:hypothetical protein